MSSGAPAWWERKNMGHTEVWQRHQIDDDGSKQPHRGAPLSPGGIPVPEAPARFEAPADGPGGAPAPRDEACQDVTNPPSRHRVVPQPLGFDPSAATFPTRLVPVGRVIDLLHLPHRPDCIARYREGMQRGERFPPISVLAVGGYYLVADGHKRRQAYLGLAPDATALLVECWPWKRWLHDQWVQSRRQQRQLAAALRGGPGSGRALRDLLSATIAHWWRVLRSLLSLALPRPRDRSGRQKQP